MRYYKCKHKTSTTASKEGTKISCASGLSFGPVQSGLDDSGWKFKESGMLNLTMCGWTTKSSTTSTSSPSN